jgi:DNA-binding NtrC family response regulator
VLLTGETGTGKEVIARLIHQSSARAGRPLVPVNCAAIPETLLESELFGYVRGAFTGAAATRRGRIAAADGGTLFLDEIAEMPLVLQAKLLRALQDGEVRKVGDTHAFAVDVRIVCATHLDLADYVRRDLFRQDLYYRLNVVEIRVPPLRERPEDIPPLVEHFIRELSPDRELSVPAAVMEQLQSRPWPGNVRELKNACERLAILCRGGEVALEDLPPAPRLRDGEAAGSAEGDLEAWPPLPPEGLSLVDLEKRVIVRALRLKGGNITQAAAYLRVPRHILVYRIEKHGIRRDA